MPTIKEARKALLLNAMGLVVIIGLSFFTGLVIFARYSHCDPITANLVEKSDQLLPYFVVDSVRNIPGLIGLFVAGITCASMSSLSSGLSALASIATYDYIGKYWPDLSDARLSFISKLSCLVLGITSYLFVFAVENMGDILPAASAILGIFLGPILGLFTLGMFFPSANTKGSMWGMFLSMFLMLLFVVGNQIASSQNLLTDQRLSLRTDGCSAWENETTTEYSPLFSSFVSADWKDKDDSALIQFLSISYLWYTSMGVVLTLFLGLTISFVVRSYSQMERSVRVKRGCLTPPAVWMWEKFAPQLFESWVESSVHVKLNKVVKSEYVDISK
jgi:Na+/proline symporter